MKSSPPSTTNRTSSVVTTCSKGRRTSRRSTSNPPTALKRCCCATSSRCSPERSWNARSGPRRPSKVWPGSGSTPNYATAAPRAHRGSWRSSTTSRATSSSPPATRSSRPSRPSSPSSRRYSSRSWTSSTSQPASTTRPTPPESGGPHRLREVRNVSSTLDFRRVHRLLHPGHEQARPRSAIGRRTPPLPGVAPPCERARGSRAATLPRWACRTSSPARPGDCATPRRPEPRQPCARCPCLAAPPTPVDGLRIPDTAPRAPLAVRPTAHRAPRDPPGQPTSSGGRWAFPGDRGRSGRPVALQGHRRLTPPGLPSLNRLSVLRRQRHTARRWRPALASGVPDLRKPPW